MLGGHPGASVELLEECKVIRDVICRVKLPFFYRAYPNQHIQSSFDFDFIDRRILGSNLILNLVLGVSQFWVARQQLVNLAHEFFAFFVDTQLKLTFG